MAALEFGIVLVIIGFAVGFLWAWDNCNHAKGGDAPHFTSLHYGKGYQVEADDAQAE